MVHPQESERLKQLYTAGAHIKALARAFGRDERTVEAALLREGGPLRQDPPLHTAWRAGLSPATVTALQTYLADLQTREERAWQQLQQAAREKSAQGYVFASQGAYDTVVHAVHPPEPLEDLACRLGVDLNRVLLAYAEWHEQAEEQQWTTDQL